MKNLFFLLFFVLSGCGPGGLKYNGNNLNPNQQEQTPSPFPVSSFSTRLSNSLLIAGVPCQGGEEAEENGRIFFCDQNQFLITVDNINTCTPQGCTNVSVQPIIASLTPFTGESSTTLFFQIIPIMIVGDQVDSILKSVLVRERQGEDTTVVFR